MNDPEPPRSVLLACRLMLISALVTAIGAIPAIITARSPEQRAAVRRRLLELEQRRPGSAGGEITDAMIDRNIPISIGIAIAITVVSVGIWVWMSRRNRAGLGWARITATVLGLLNLVLLPMSSGRAQGNPWTIGINVLLVALTAVILILLWRPESSRYYREATH